MSTYTSERSFRDCDKHCSVFSADAKSVEKYESFDTKELQDSFEESYSQTNLQSRRDLLKLRVETEGLQYIIKLHDKIHHLLQQKNELSEKLAKNIQNFGEYFAVYYKIQHYSQELSIYEDILRVAKECASSPGFYEKSMRQMVSETELVECRPALPSEIKRDIEPSRFTMKHYFMKKIYTIDGMRYLHDTVVRVLDVSVVNAHHYHASGLPEYLGMPLYIYDHNAFTTLENAKRIFLMDNESLELSHKKYSEAERKKHSLTERDVHMLRNISQETDKLESVLQKVSLLDWQQTKYLFIGEVMLDRIAHTVTDLVDSSCFDVHDSMELLVQEDRFKKHVISSVEIKRMRAKNVKQISLLKTFTDRKVLGLYNHDLHRVNIYSSEYNSE